MLTSTEFAAKNEQPTLEAFLTFLEKDANSVVAAIAFSKGQRFMVLIA